MTNPKNRADLKADLKAELKTKTDKLVSQDKELFANLSKEEIKKRARNFDRLKDKVKTQTDELISQDKELFANLSKEEITEKKKERARNFREENKWLLDNIRERKKLVEMTMDMVLKNGEKNKLTDISFTDFENLISISQREGAYKLFNVLSELGANNDVVLKQYGDFFNFYCSQLNRHFKNTLLLSIFNYTQGDFERLRTLLHGAEKGKIAAKILGLEFPISEVSRYNNWTPESFLKDVQKELEKCVTEDSFRYANHIPLVKKSKLK
ncbi:MAG TPA: hypothetical protein P5060_02800 [Candidatus Absconditabacterales bacterium]|nr:hypothetical protein [Candidatus Absconditabacterales bacterium]